MKNLSKKNFTADQIQIIGTYLNIGGKNQNEEQLSLIKNLLGDTPSAAAGVNELQFIVNKTKSKNISLVVDFTLARGLNYYTGIIFEAKAPAQVQIGSIGGGGRYDDLTGLFGVPDVPGVGISFGVDRIYDVMEEMNLFPAEIDISTTVLFFNEGEEALEGIVELADALRAKKVSCEVYPDKDKEDKQFKYAKRKNIPYIITSNTDDQNFRLKNINTGETFNMAAHELLSFRFA